MGPSNRVLAGILLAAAHRPVPAWCVVELVNALVPGDRWLTARAFGRAFRAITGQTYTQFSGGGSEDVRPAVVRAAAANEDERVDTLEAVLDERRRAIAFVAARARGRRRSDPWTQLTLAIFRRSLA